MNLINKYHSQTTQPDFKALTLAKVLNQIFISNFSLRILLISPFPFPQNVLYRKNYFPQAAFSSLISGSDSCFQFIAFKITSRDFPGGPKIKNPPANAEDPRDMGLTPGSGRSPGEGNGNLLQYSGLENSMECIVHGVAKSRTQLSDFHFHGN